MLEPCIESVLKNTDFKKAHLILIDDKSPDERVLPLLKRLAKNNKDKITLIINDENLGFVGTANKGMKLSKNDVLLLNSDTEVSKGWLDKIMSCALIGEDIATVTPLSSNAMWASVPVFNEENGLPKGYDLNGMANIVDGCSMQMFPEIPSGHGFCLYIKREALDKVGYFDEETFGKGYGEENDFCFRCFRYGYKHILCDNAYVLHKGAQSFEQKGDHVDELSQKYPKIMEEVGWWYAKRDIKIIGDNIALRISTLDDKINVLIETNNISKKILSAIDSLRSEFNIHVLLDKGGIYKIKSFFAEYELETAIYDRPITVYDDVKKSKVYREMLDEIKDIFGISVIEQSDALNNEGVEVEFRKTGKIKKINYNKIRAKMLECDFVRNLKIDSEINGAKKALLAEKKKLLAEKEWRDNLTVPQRIYLKIRYILLGR